MRFLLALKYISSLLFIVFLVSCADLDRENVLDPKNPSSRTENVYLIEAFVNTNSKLDSLGMDFSKRAITALNEIKILYGDQVIVCEYHRDSEDPKINFPDQYALQDNRFEVLYTKYVEFNNQGDKGVPDIFINGAAHRIQGAYSVSSTKDRLIDVISELSFEETEYILDPEISIAANTITVSCKVARLRNQSAQDLRLRLIFTKDFGGVHLGNVVVAEDQLGRYSKSIQGISAGNHIKVQFESIRLIQFPDMVTIVLTNNDETEVLTSIRVGL